MRAASYPAREQVAIQGTTSLPQPSGEAVSRGLADLEPRWSAGLVLHDGRARTDVGTGGNTTDAQTPRLRALAASSTCTIVLHHGCTGSPEESSV